MSNIPASVRRLMLASSSGSAIVAGQGIESSFSMPRKRRRRHVSKYMPHTGPKRFRPNDTPELQAERAAADRAYLEAEALANDRRHAEAADGSTDVE